MPYIIRLVLWTMVLTAGATSAAPETGDFENDLEIVDESYFIEDPYFIEEPRPKTVIRGQAAWTPFNIGQGFSTAHLMTEKACRTFLQSLRNDAGTACMNVHSGRIVHSVDFIGPVMP